MLLCLMCHSSFNTKQKAAIKLDKKNFYNFYLDIMDTLRLSR